MADLIRNDAQNDELDLVQMGRILWAKKRIIAGLALGSAILVGFVSFFILTPRYESIAVITESKGPGLSGNLQAIANSSPFGMFLSQTAGQSQLMEYAGILKSRQLVASMIEKQNLLEKFNIPPGTTEKSKTLAIEGLINRIRNSTNIVIEKIFLKVSYQNPSAALAKDVVTWYLDGLSEFIHKNMTTRARSSEVFIEARLKEVEGDLRKVETAFISLKKNTGVVQLPSQIELSLRTAAQLRYQILNKDLEISLFKNVMRESGEIQQLESEKKQLQAQLDKLIGAEGTKPRTSKSGRIDLLTPLSSGSSLEIEFSHVERNYLTLVKLAELLRQQLELARIETKKSEPVYQIVDAPVEGVLPVFPNKKLNVLIAFFFTLTVASSWILIRARLQGPRPLARNLRATPPSSRGREIG